MDRYISDFEAREGFPELIRDVQHGESFTVTVDGQPVARVTPVEPFTGDKPNDTADLQRQAESLKEFLAEMRAQPTRTCDWKREDLYDR